MALPINPQSQLVAKISSDLQAAAGAVKSSLSNLNVPNALDKAALDKKINDLSGGVGSSYNWAGGYSGAASTLGDAAKTAQSTISGGISTLQNTAGGFSNVTSDLNRVASFANKLTGGNIAGTIQNLAAKASGFAGQINNLLSVARGKGIPKGAEIFASQGGATQISASSESDWRVKIRLSSPNTYEQLLGSNPFINLIKDRDGVVWPYLPNITLTTKANYSTIDSVHSNYPFYAYKNSAVEDITISGEFSAETANDAAYWVAATLFLRTVTKMFFGQGPNAGNPPPICVLDGYGTSVFKNIPVIVKSFSVDFKDDVNYIYYQPTKTWVPIMSTISVTVAPIYNRSRLREFDLRSYAAGQMIDAKQNVGMI